MRITVLTSVFPPEPLASSLTSARIARELSDRGHVITVVAAFPNRPGGKTFSGYSRVLVRRENDCDGFAVLRCFCTLSRHSTWLSRLFENLSFGLTSTAVLMTQKRPDAIYANTWPIIAGGLAAIAGRLRNVPIILSIQDVYPDSLVAQGRIGNNSICARFLRRIDGAVARQAAAVIALSETFAEIYRISRQVRAQRVHVVPNWIDPKALPEILSNDDLRSRFGIPREAFLVVYSGNVGVAAGVETVISAFALLAHLDVYLLIAGEGSNRAQCQALTRGQQTLKVLFHFPYPASDTPAVLGAADLCIVPTRGSQSFASMPSKALWYMLASRPILALALPDSELAKTVENSGCGWIVEPDKPDVLAEAIITISKLGKAELERRGRCGREYVRETDTSVKRLIEIIEDTARQGGPSYRRNELPAQANAANNHISRMKFSDLPDVVAVHLRSFPGFFLSGLGPRFLRCLYQEILADRAGISFVYKREERLLGFAAGTWAPDGFYRKLLKRRWPAFALASVAPLIKNPAILPRLLSAVRNRPNEVKPVNRGLLLSIAVEPSTQSCGVGSALVEGFLEECRTLGLSSVHLTTDRDRNEAANSFYAKLGFTVSGVFTTPQGRVMNDYRIEILPQE
jgi:colanic acid biosynthesis glycosyl transferase WcaI